jgi:hypothetical protein
MHCFLIDGGVKPRERERENASMCVATAAGGLELIDVT